jgi:hypothetical protein
LVFSVAFPIRSVSRIVVVSTPANRARRAGTRGTSRRRTGQRGRDGAAIATDHEIHQEHRGRQLECDGQAEQQPARQGPYRRVPWHRIGQHQRHQHGVDLAEVEVGPHRLE